MNMIDLLNANKGSLFSSNDEWDMLILAQTEGDGNEIGIVFYDQFGDYQSDIANRHDFDISYAGAIIKDMKKKVSNLDIMNFIFQQEKHHKPHKINALYKSARLSSSR